MTRDELEKAVRVVREGRPIHSLCAIEDAKAALKPIARYQWRQTAVMVFCLMVGALMAPKALPNWPLFAACFTGGVAGNLIASLIMTAPPLRSFFAPPGLGLGHVTAAALAAFAASGRPTT
jgi:hypothetical protein